MSDRSVAIIGAGIAGVSAAIALRLRGFAVEVFEASEGPGHMGAGLVCWPNACFVLHELGVLEGLRKLAGTPLAMKRMSASGELLGQIDIAKLNSLSGWPSISVFRRDLHRLLLDRLSELGVQIQYGCGALAIESGARGARVRLASGRWLEADLIIGADGRMRSVSRGFVHGDASPRFAGFVNWIGTIEAERSLFPSMSILDVWGVGLRFGIVPISPTRAYWAAAASQPEITPLAPELRGAMLMESFAHWPQPIETLLREHSGEIHQVHVHDHDAIDVWHRENLLLIGDAAHAALPTSGQGACQALEDAWHLAAVLSENDNEPLADLLTRFTLRRAAKTRGIGSGARWLAASLFDSDPERCQRRDADARTTDYDGLVVGMARGWWAGLPNSPAAI